MKSVNIILTLLAIFTSLPKVQGAWDDWIRDLIDGEDVRLRKEIEAKAAEREALEMKLGTYEYKKFHPAIDDITIFSDYKEEEEEHREAKNKMLYDKLLAEAEYEYPKSKDEKISELSKEELKEAKKKRTFDKE